ncbi:hypothetical protein GCM10009827_050410 [Dactylosporangium maewongense]|uniref:Uncharacterized protein n=1 Tax=Dactylosporangium maewongense TaxID=634393 RepID=A0ABN2AVT5_9ACTN
MLAASGDLHLGVRHAELGHVLERQQGVVVFSPLLAALRCGCRRPALVVQAVERRGVGAAFRLGCLPFRTQTLVNAPVWGLCSIEGARSTYEMIFKVQVDRATSMRGGVLTNVWVGRQVGG